MRPGAGMLALAAAVLLLGAAPSVAATAFLYASPSGSTSAASCTDQSAPCSLPHALSLAHDGDDLTVLPGEYDLAAQLQAPVAVAMHGVAGSPRPVIVGKGGFNIPIQMGNGGGSLRHLAFQTPSGDGYVLDANLALIEDVSISSPGVTGGGILLRTGALRDSTVFVTTNTTNVAGVLARGGSVRNVTSVVSSVQTTGNVGLEVDAAGNDLSVAAINVIAMGPGADVGAHNSSASAGSATLTIDHSDFAKAPYTSGHGASVTQTATVAAAPMLVDAAHGDFHEVLGSPTIDAGISDPANGTADLDGNPRELGAGPDIGAFEFVAPPPTVTTSAATAVTQTSATLNGSVNPNDGATTAQFIIDSGPGAPMTIAAASLPAGMIAQAESASATGLTAGTTYTFHLHAANATGPGDGAEQSFTTAAATPTTPPTVTPPVLSNFGMTHSRFVTGRPRHGVPKGTAFTFTLSEPAAVTISIQRLAAGRRSHGHCVAPSRRLRHARRCTRNVAAGSLHSNAQAGAGRIVLPAKFHGKPLAPGRYRATISAASGALRSKSFTHVFTIVAAR